MYTPALEVPRGIFSVAGVLGLGFRVFGCASLPLFVLPPTTTIAVSIIIVCGRSEHRNYGNCHCRYASQYHCITITRRINISIIVLLIILIITVILSVSLSLSVSASVSLLSSAGQLLV